MAAMERFQRFRNNRFFRLVVGGSAIGVAVAGSAATAAVLSDEPGDAAETDTVSLDLEDGQVEVSVDESDAADVLDDEGAGIAEETPTPPTPPTPDSPDSPPTPPSPDSPDSPPTPPSPDSPDTPDTPESPDSPEGDDD